MTHNELKQLAQEMEKKKPSLIICGGGHIGYYLAELGHMLDFEVTLIDDREAFANTSRFPHAKVICEPFAEAMTNLLYTPDSYFVIVTRGHSDDAYCLEKVIENDFAYAGMIGSKAKIGIVMEKMRGKGFTDEVLSKVHTPIGLKIGAITPAEIGVCIAAELIQVKSQKDGSGYVGRDIIESILRDEVVVTATIIEQRGSAPRGVGSMLVLKKDGSIAGSVGGGSAENEVIERAKLLVGSKDAEVMCCNMTNKNAAQAGMICGGKVNVRIQPIQF